MLEVLKVRDGIYRGRRPQTCAEVEQLRDEHRINRILNLQGWILEEAQVIQESLWCVQCGVIFRHCPMDLLNPPKPEELRATAAIARQMASNVYVHCHDGVDRTGMLCATIKIQDGGITVGGAIGDMIDDGFHLEVYAFWIKQLKGI